MTRVDTPETARYGAPTRPSRPPMFELRWWTLPLVVGVAYLPRLFNLARIENYLEDYMINAPGAVNYVRFGIPVGDNWFTQPAKHLTMYLSIALFGNDPFGWSMRQVLLGTGVVLVTFLLARRVFRSALAAGLAAALVALDPAWLAFSRAGSEDPQAVLCLLLTMFFWTRAVQEDSRWDMAAAGVFAGLATATRWYAGLVALLILVTSLIMLRRQGARALLRTLALLGALPVAVYVATYLPWIARGNSIADLASMQWDAYVVQQTSSYPDFGPALAPLAGPTGWFTRWMGVVMVQSTSGGRGAFTALMNDPVVWWMFVPAVAYVCWAAWRGKLPEFWVVGGSFIVLAVFFLSARRPIYLYSALCLVPLGAMSLGFLVSKLPRRWAMASAGAIVAWECYLYPLTSSIDVPLAPYAWILRLLGLQVMGP